MEGGNDDLYHKWIAEGGLWELLYLERATFVRSSPPSISFFPAQWRTFRMFGSILWRSLSVIGSAILASVRPFSLRSCGLLIVIRSR